jgi:hypothetical protein
VRAGRINRRAIHFTVCALLGASASSVLGQTGRPAPASPQPARADDVPPAAPQNGRPQAEPPARNGVGDGNPSQYRRPAPEGKVILAFDNVPVEETIPFVVETTGKVVMPVKLNTLRAQTITLINDNPIPRSQALDLLFAAFRLNDIGVVEREDRIIIGSITDIVSTGIEMPVLGPDDDVMYRQDLGNFGACDGRGDRRAARGEAPGLRQPHGRHQLEPDRRDRRHRSPAAPAAADQRARQDVHQGQDEDVQAQVR